MRRIGGWKGGERGHRKRRKHGDKDGRKEEGDEGDRKSEGWGREDTQLLAESAETKDKFVNLRTRRSEKKEGKFIL